MRPRKCPGRDRVSQRRTLFVEQPDRAARNRAAIVGGLWVAAFGDGFVPADMPRPTEECGLLKFDGVEYIADRCANLCLGAVSAFADLLIATTSHCRRKLTSLPSRVALIASDSSRSKRICPSLMPTGRE